MYIKFNVLYRVGRGDFQITPNLESPGYPYKDLLCPCLALTKKISKKI